MKAPLYNIKAEKIGDVTLPKTTFETKVDNDLIATAVRVYLANQRKSHAKTKERGEVAGTTKKMWSQKGTGRARHGSAKAPIFVGGGIAHGPTGAQNFKLTLNKKVRRLALKSILSKFATGKSILVIDKISDLEPKTKVAWSLMDLLEKDNQLLAKSKKIGIITSEGKSNVTRAFRNIKDINLLSLKTLNVYDLSNQNFLIFTKKAIESFGK